jgi:hypothetical protein
LRWSGGVDVGSGNVGVNDVDGCDDDGDEEDIRDSW